MIPMSLTVTYSFFVKSRITLLEISQGSNFKAEPFKDKRRGKLAWIQLKLFEERTQNTVRNTVSDKTVEVIF